MNWISASFSLTHRYYFTVLRRFWGPLVGLGLVGVGFDEFTSRFQKLIDQLDSPPMFLIAVVLLISLLWQAISSALVIVLGSLGLHDALSSQTTSSSFLQTTQTHLRLLTIETLRSLGSALVWCFAFLVPGFIKYVRYSFVPYVVLFEPAYAQGNIDALERSNELVKGHTGAFSFLITVYFLSLLIFSALTQSFHTSLFENPLIALGSQAFFQAMNLYFALFLFASYQSLTKTRPLVT